MRFLSLISLLAVPATVLACEGDCIVGCTNAWLGNYTTVIDSVMNSLAAQICDLIPSRPSVETSLGYLKPILSAYHKQSYDDMETAIFPSYFHGKCLDENGNTPAGCPNPDCPVVCGTPGSMVHFYPKLRYIAHNQTSHLLEALATPGSHTYQQVEDAVVAAANTSPQRRRIYNALPGPNAGSSGLTSLFSGLLPRGNGLASLSSTKKVLPELKRRTQDVKAGLKSVMAQVGPLMKEECGGDGENTNGLPKCSWEAEMKQYILSFP
ncbi:hypothetical protein OH76DRAFT_1361605 [Lentinus brumalis]|uniref:Uncharacterized protein n=1 Tax=Lentinus brumalis TaxID=2498619 RepID=A0A371CS44_9APHY|nr:hypothetical protein OH76DRAFT_1361605 [Polyporus brumalis]